MKSSINLAFSSFLWFSCLTLSLPATTRSRLNYQPVNQPILGRPDRRSTYIQTFFDDFPDLVFVLFLLSSFLFLRPSLQNFPVAKILFVRLNFKRSPGPSVLFDKLKYVGAVIVCYFYFCCPLTRIAYKSKLPIMHIF